MGTNLVSLIFRNELGKGAFCSIVKNELERLLVW